MAQVKDSIKNKTTKGKAIRGQCNNDEENKNMEDQCDLSIDEINQEEASLSSNMQSSDKPEVQSNHVMEESILSEKNKVHILTN